MWAPCLGGMQIKFGVEILVSSLVDQKKERQNFNHGQFPHESILRFKIANWSDRITEKH